VIAYPHNHVFVASGQTSADALFSGTQCVGELSVEAVLYRYRTGMPWRDLPQRFSRLTKSGVCE
jgi:hypothetical protein